MTKEIRTYNRMIIMAVILALACLFTSCGPDKKQAADKGDTKAKAGETADNGSREEETGAWVFDYVDAHGKKHQAVIDPDLAMHDYDWTKLVREDGGTLSYSDGRYRTRRGIDISSHQGDIDWTKVRAAGNEFAFVRVVYRAYGEKGQLFADEKARDNIAAAQKEIGRASCRERV